MANSEDRKLDISILVAGAAGEGIQTIGGIAARTILAHGYPAFASQEFESRIRGGSSGYRLRVDGVNAPKEEVDILLALNSEARDHYRKGVRDGGLIISNADGETGEVAVPFKEIAKESFGSEIYANTLAVGSLCAALGIPLETLSTTLRQTFGKADEAVMKANLAAAGAGYEKMGGHSPLSPLPARKLRHTHLSAHEAIPLAASYAGCRFMAAYPMSPSTGIITAFSRDEGLGVFVEQAEDEIGAVNMAIGASYAGARAMTATSGGGFALMVESISLAGMTETPLVIVLAQRPGPATGLPTRTAQEDLLFAINAGHGEFPKAVLAPADAKDAFAKTVKAFDLAERYQVPVIVLTDQYLADSRFSYTEFPIADRNANHDFADPAAFSEYHRYALAQDGVSPLGVSPLGVSPRLYPGQSAHLVCADSDEHDEDGHITEDLATMRPAMVAKRLAKLESLRRSIAPPDASHIDDSDEVIIGWGSTRGAINEAAEKMRAQGHRVGTIHFTELWPLPEYTFPEGKRYIIAEGNATGQLARLLMSEYGLRVAGTIRRSDGLPLTAEYIEGGFDDAS